MSRLVTLTVSSLLFLITTSTIRAQDILLTEDLDSIVEPALPSAWTAEGSGWSTSASSASTGSGLNNLAHTGSSPGSISTPSLDFSGYANGQLTYLARRTSSYPQDALIVSASIDGGLTFPFPIASAGSALPGATSTYGPISVSLPSTLSGQPAVMVRFEALGGTTGGANIRLDDVIIAATMDTVVTEPSTSDNRLGFALASSSTLESSEVYLALSLEAADSLQGIQFTSTWSSPLLSLIDVERGISVADSSAWFLDWSVQNDSIRVILLGQGTEALAPGIRPSFLSLHFQTASLDSVPQDTVRIGLTDALASRPNPIGNDAGLILDQFYHDLEIHVPRSNLSVSLDSLDFGSVSTDSVAHRYFLLSNLNGSKDLLVSSMQSDSEVFSIPDTTFVLPPDQSASIRASFGPTNIRFGSLAGVLSIVHDGFNGPESSVRVAGLGVGGRGDVDRDGHVDVVDVIVGIDATLRRITLRPERVSSVDLYPFPSGDGGIDVRDLTVLVQAIVRARWPDMLLLPPALPPAQTPSFRIPVGSTVSERTVSTVPVVKSAPAEIYFKNVENNLVDVFLSTTVAMRGLQLELGGVATVVSSSESMSLTNANPVTSSFHEPQTGILRLLLATSLENAVGPGDIWLARIRFSDSATHQSLQSATGVDVSLQRILITIRPVALTSTSHEVPVADALDLAPPYPNPFLSAPGRAMTFPFTTASMETETHLEIYDLLGRRILERAVTSDESVYRWRPSADGRPLTPGLYFVRISDGRQSVVRTFAVLRGL